jgi:hypothetical protein
MRLIGVEVAHHRILEKLGNSGIGVIYKARDTCLGLFRGAQDAVCGQSCRFGAKGRFIREAKALRTLATASPGRW